jgi:hypothetical protein
MTMKMFESEEELISQCVSQTPATAAQREMDINQSFQASQQLLHYINIIGSIAPLSSLVELKNALETIHTGNDHLGDLAMRRRDS